MAAAYASFAADGIYRQPRTYVKVTASDGETVVLEKPVTEHVAMKETTAYFMNKLLQGVVTGGTGTSARFNGMAIAGKTGTTSDNYDRYFAGYTPYYAAAVWTGYDQPEKISASGNPAITMWKKVMEEIHMECPNKPFNKPESGYTSVEVCMDSGLLPTDACRADLRGARVMTVEVPQGSEPAEHCAMHTVVSYCTEGKCLSGLTCPTVTTVGVLDIVREEYFTNPDDPENSRILAEDDAYVLSSLQKAIEPVLPTEENPVGSPGGCPVHNGLYLDPELYPGILDPNSPFYDPSGGFGDAEMYPGYPNYPAYPEAPVVPEHPGAVTPPVETPVQPETPPVAPVEPDPNEDWFADLWQDPV
jgi:penicillin-binding protein 1A